ncbi:uncharacterized protein V6R79_011645 [Siganus canaliculatus]
MCIFSGLSGLKCPSDGSEVKTARLADGYDTKTVLNMKCSRVSGKVRRNTLPETCPLVRCSLSPDRSLINCGAKPFTLMQIRGGLMKGETRKRDVVFVSHLLENLDNVKPVR